MELFRHRSEQAQQELEYQKARKVAEQYWENGAKFVTSENIAGHLGLWGKEVEFTTILVGGKILKHDIDLLEEKLRGYDESPTKISGIPAWLNPNERNAERRRVLRNGQRIHQSALDDMIAVMREDPVAYDFYWTLNNAINNLFTQIYNNRPNGSSSIGRLTVEAMGEWSELWHQRLLSNKNS